MVSWFPCFPRHRTWRKANHKSQTPLFSPAQCRAVPCWTGPGHRMPCPGLVVVDGGSRPSPPQSQGCGEREEFETTSRAPAGPDDRHRRCRASGGGKPRASLRVPGGDPPLPRDDGVISDGRLVCGCDGGIPQRRSGKRGIWGDGDSHFGSSSSVLAPRLFSIRRRQRDCSPVPKSQSSSRRPCALSKTQTRRCLFPCSVALLVAGRGGCMD